MDAFLTFPVTAGAAPVAAATATAAPVTAATAATAAATATAAPVTAATAATAATATAVPMTATAAPVTAAPVTAVPMTATAAPVTAATAAPVTTRTAVTAPATDDYPSSAMAEREMMAGLYPDSADPDFAARLYAKREFYEARAVAASLAEGMDPCTSTDAQRVFELTPVQRIVSRFMHPATPYMGMLLYHGVGVGKTCSAVTIAEQFIEASPATQVIIVAPQAIQDSFKRTIFDPAKLTWDESIGQWTSAQCTGTTYLDRLGLLTDHDAFAPGGNGPRKVNEERLAHYKIIGYQAFANFIERTLKNSLPASLVEGRQAAEDEILRRMFSNKLIIIDEAHNLRDVASGEKDALTASEDAENAGGKALNPLLKRIVLNAEGLRLVLMTATPMYNSAPEIVLLLSILYMNDQKKRVSELKPSTYFTPDGDLKPEKAYQLEKLARRYVSYMRGENPYTFPLRMKPVESGGASAAWADAVSATKIPIDLTETDSAILDSLPIVLTQPDAGSVVDAALRAAGTGETVMLDVRMQIANITYPDSTYGSEGWESHFTSTVDSSTGNKLRQFTGTDVDAIFGEGLQTYAPKIKRIVDSVSKAEGICFVYTRYVKAGLLPLAVALERAGFQRRMKDGQLLPLLAPGGQEPVAPRCAICGTTDSHEGADHTFQPACYVMLTSEPELCPKIDDLIKLSTTWDDTYGPLGGKVKVIIGSQVASEGLDLKCVRELHVLDSWYHLNRTDQIIGRAIRYCSHSALRSVETQLGRPAMSMNNCLIYLHVAQLAASEMGPALETADMYAYRLAIRKAQKMGLVQRLLKRHAWDCNLELAAISFAGLPLRTQFDAQRHDRRSGVDLSGYSIDDQNYTTYCDYQVCAHGCARTTEYPLDMSTFGAMDARRIVLAKQAAIRRLFQNQVMVPEAIVADIFSDLPWEIKSEALMELIDGRHFQIRRPDGVVGFLVKKAEYLVFQPAAVTDTDIPMALRYARAFQLRRRFMAPRMPVLGGRPEVVPVAAGLERWTEWIAFVGGGPPPASLNAPQGKVHPNQLWSWLLRHFAGVRGVDNVALRWWFDIIATHEEKHTILRAAIAGGESRGLEEDIYRDEDAYRLFNPSTNRVEVFCGPDFIECNSDITALVLEELTRPVDLANKAALGQILGFLACKETRLVFKTLDTTAKTSKKSMGVECGRSSNLSVHQPRVVALHESAGALPVLPDDPETWDEGRRNTLAPNHMMDLTHQPLCLYMEFLTRIMDQQLVMVGGAGNQKRWFVNICDAVSSGLIG